MFTLRQSPDWADIEDDWDYDEQLQEDVFLGKVVRRSECRLRQRPIA